MTAFAHRLPLFGLLARGVRPFPLFAACFALGAFSIFQYPLNHDVSWILSMAAQVRGGARLYVDIIELNPPLIVWLNLPVVAAAELAHVDPGHLLRVAVLALALACIGLAARILRGRFGSGVGQSLSFAACYATVAAAGYDFAQREHITLLLSLPYLAMAAVRLEGGHAGKARWRLGVALLAAVGLALKPHFLLVPLLVEGLVMWRTRRGIDAGAYAIAAFTALYLGAIVLLTPEFLPLARMVATVYGAGYLGIGMLSFLWVPNFHAALLFALVAWLVRPAPRAVFHVVSAAALGFAAAALIQSKGWSYHWYPAAALGWLLLGIAAHALLARRGGAWDTSAPLLVGAVMLFLATLAALAAPRKGSAENPVPALFTPVIAELGGGPVMVFSNALRVSYPLLTQPGVGSSSRLPTVALLSAAIGAKQANFERYLRHIIVDDMLNKPPQLLIVETAPAGPSASFDFIDYLSREPDFARAMASFRFVRSVAGFRVYQRVRPPPAAP